MTNHWHKVYKVNKIFQGKKLFSNTSHYQNFFGQNTKYSAHWIYKPASVIRVAVAIGSVAALPRGWIQQPAGRYNKRLDLATRRLLEPVRKKNKESIETSKTWFYKLPAAIFPIFYQKKFVEKIYLSLQDNLVLFGVASIFYHVSSVHFTNFGLLYY